MRAENRDSVAFIKGDRLTFVIYLQRVRLSSLYLLCSLTLVNDGEAKGRITPVEAS